MSENKDFIIAGIDINKIGKGKDGSDVLYSIVKPFNFTLRRLTKLLINNVKDVKNNKYIRIANENLSWGDKYIPNELIKKTYRSILNPNVKKNIINGNWDYFKSKDYSKFVVYDKFRKSIEFIIGFIKDRFSDLTSDEIEHIHNLLLIMLICCDEYVLYLKKYKKKTDSEIGIYDDEDIF